MRFEKDKPEKSSKIPYFFIAFFAIIIVVNLLYIYLSQKSWRGVLLPESYRRGIEYNETLKLEEEQKKLGWKVEIQSVDLGDGKFEITAIPRNSAGAQIEDGKLKIEFKRTASEGDDFITNFDFIDGVYRSQIQFPAKGKWNFGILLQKDEKIYREVQSLMVKW